MRDAPAAGLPSERDRVEALHALGLPRRATADEVRAAYIGLARDLHPDLHGGDEARAERFRQVAAAYELLRRYHRQVASTPPFDPKQRQRPEGFDERWWTAFGERV